jgi:hypothetical protein
MSDLYWGETNEATRTQEATIRNEDGNIELRVWKIPDPRSDRTWYWRTAIDEPSPLESHRVSTCGLAFTEEGAKAEAAGAAERVARAFLVLKGLVRELSMKRKVKTEKTSE